MKEKTTTTQELHETLLKLYVLISELGGGKIKHAPEKYIKLKLDNLFLLIEYLEQKSLHYFANEFPDYFPKN